MPILAVLSGGVLLLHLVGTATKVEDDIGKTTPLASLQHLISLLFLLVLV